jgi:hypothetical protein
MFSRLLSFHIKAFAIFSAVIIFCSQTGAIQLLKLPELRGHLSEHQQKDKTLSFADFILMHYYGSDGDTSDDSREENLPFKTATAAASAFIVPQVSCDVPKTQLMAEYSHARIRVRVPAAPCCDIWQPPRL